MKHKGRDILYSIDSKPPLTTLVGLSFTYLVKFMLIIITPIIIGDLANAPNPEILNLISISLIAAAISTLLISNKKYLGAGYFLPVHSSISCFAILAIAAKTGGLPLVFGTTVMLGIFQFLFGFLLRNNPRFFNIKLTGFILALISLWLASIGVNELFHSRALGQLVIHSSDLTLRSFTRSHVNLISLILGIITLVATLLCLFIRKMRVYSLLFGMLFGWIICATFGWIDQHKIRMINRVSWFRLPIPFHHIHFQFKLSFLLPSIIIALIAALEIFANTSAIHHKLNQKLNMKKIRHTNWLASLGTIISGLSGGLAQGPNSAGIADLILTNAYSRFIAYGYALGLLILAFSPKLMFLFLTLPAGANAAIVLLMGAILLIQGLQMLEAHKLGPAETRSIGVAILVAIGTMTIPELYKFQYMPWLRWFTDRTVVSGLITLAVMALLFQLRFKRSE